MKIFNLTNMPEVRPVLKNTITHIAFIGEPFIIDTQEGMLTMSPETCDDWKYGYYVAYPSDGSKPYGIAPSYVDDNYVPVPQDDIL